MNRVLFASIFLSALAGVVVSATAAQSYSTPDSLYSQNFNSLTTTNNTSSPTAETGAWVDNSTIPGWYFLRDTGAAATNYTMADGHAPGQGRMLSIGSDGSSDRGLGSQNSNLTDANMRFGLQLSNTTGLTLGAFSLGYTGEEWRVIGGEPADALTFEYQIFAAGTGSLSAATGWTSVSSLAFTTPITGGSSRMLDGNAAANRTVIAPFQVSGLSWTDGSELWIRWTDNSGSMNLLDTLGIDDVTFTAAVPEPCSAVFLLGGVALLGLGRRRG